MLKLFNSQRKITAFLVRACLPSVASSGLRNTDILKEFRRSNANSGNERAVDFRAKYYVWSLTSSHGDSLMKLDKIQEADPVPEIKCNGDFDHESNLVLIEDASLNANIAMIALLLEYNGDGFYLSVEKERKHKDDSKCMVVMKPVSEGRVGNNQRFIQWEYRGFSMFESLVHRGGYLGCKKDGSLDLIDVYHMLQPDPRVLFLLHAKNPLSPN